MENTYIITRGNVDGIVSAGFLLAKHPEAEVAFVPSETAATKEINVPAPLTYIADIGLSQGLTRAINEAARERRIVYIDHHQHSADYAIHFLPEVTSIIEDSPSAAALIHKYLGLNESHEKLVAIADHVETRESDDIEISTIDPKVREEARIIDFAWRYNVEDDAFRLKSALSFSLGKLPSEVPEIVDRYVRVATGNYWEKAKRSIESRLRIRNGVALLQYGKRKPSLHGFGSLALSEVAREKGADIALLINIRDDLASIALRYTGKTGNLINLGSYVHEFTSQYGLAGGGHPDAAGAKIRKKDLPLFLEGLYKQTTGKK